MKKRETRKLLLDQISSQTPTDRLGVLERLGMELLDRVDKLETTKAKVISAHPWILTTFYSGEEIKQIATLVPGSFKLNPNPKPKKKPAKHK